MSRLEADPESARFAVYDNVLEDAEVRYEALCDFQNLPAVVIVYADNTALSGVMIGAALARNAKVYLVGEHAEATFIDLTSKGVDGLLLAADAAEAAEQAVLAAKG